jgi:hypothetical protein
LFPNQPYSDTDRLLRLHLYCPHQKILQIVYVYEDATLPYMASVDGPVVGHKRLVEESLMSPGLQVRFEGTTYTVLRRLGASKAFMEEVNPDHFA